MGESANKDLFEKSEYQWGERHRGKLTRGEQYLIKKYVKGGNILEAGCGGGRLSLYIDDHYRCRMDAFDFVEDFVKKAKQEKSNVNFFVADASNLSEIDDAKYDTAVYLQRLISFVPPNSIDNTIQESYRVLKQGGKLICSVLNYKGRAVNRPLSLVLSILRCIRKEQGLKAGDLPWLKLGGKPNYGLLKRNQPTVHWFTKKEIYNSMRNAGYKIVEEYIDRKTPSILYLVCRKTGI